MNPKVFVVQKTDAEKSLDSAAKQYGDLVFLFEGFVDLRNPAWVETARERLSSYTEEDFLLLSGNKLLNAVSTGMLAVDPKIKVVNFLHWFGPYSQYVIHQWRKSIIKTEGGDSR